MFASHGLFIGCHRNQVSWFSEADIKRDVRAGFLVGAGDGGLGGLVGISWLARFESENAGTEKTRSRRSNGGVECTLQLIYIIIIKYHLTSFASGHPQLFISHSKFSARVSLHSQNFNKPVRQFIGLFISPRFESLHAPKHMEPYFVHPRSVKLRNRVGTRPCLRPSS